MKRISNKLFLYSLTSLVITASSLAYAKQLAFAPTLAGNVTAAIGTFYAAPSADNQNYAVIIDQDSNSKTYSVVNITPDYAFGFEAFLGYIFPKTANGIELSYRYLYTNDADSSVSSFENTPGVNGESELNYKLNAFDLLASQFLNIGEHMQMRFTGGLAYVELKQEQKSTTHLTYAGSSFLEQKNKSEFSGWGPRIGVDSRYGFDSGFGIVGGGSVAYYLGVLDLTWSQFSSASDFTANVEDDLDNHGITNLRANLGIDYAYLFDNKKLSTLGIELGYQIDYYNDVVGSLNEEATYLSPFLGEPVELYPASFSGPYLNVKGAF